MSEVEQKPNLLKEKALEILENHLVQAVDDVIAIGKIYVAETDNAWDDTVLSFLESLKGSLIDQIDKIDGKDNK